MTILLLDPYFKIKDWIYRGILGVLAKKIIKSNSIPSHSSQFRKEWKFEVLREYRRMSVPSYSFHSLSLKLSNKGMNFPFLLLKLLNKRREEYSKIIFFIHFLSILFPPPKRGLRVVSPFQRSHQQRFWSHHQHHI